MPEVEIDKKTRWECQRCGGCCRGIIISTNKNLSTVKDGIFGNKNLQRRLEKMGHDLAIRFKECFERGGDVSGII